MMFAELARFPRIVVSGPHRSGTTIAAEMIGEDTGHRVIREEAFAYSNAEQFAAHMSLTGVVLQAPFMAHALHYLGELVEPESLCVVFMVRPADEILDSQRRVGVELVRYRQSRFHTHERGPSVIYENWQAQRTRIRHFREVPYESLKAHPRWVEQRQHFGLRQTA